MTTTERQLPEILSVWSNELKGRLDPLYYSKDIFDFLSRTKYETVLFADVIDFVKAGFAAGKQDQAGDENGIVQIRPTNINELGILKFDKNIILPRNLITQRPQDILQKGEVLFNNTNSQDLVGKTAYFNLDGEYFCSNHVTRIKVDEKKILPQFVWKLLNSYQTRGIFYNICVNWNNQSGVNIELLKNLKIPLPTILRQREILGILDKAYAQKQRKEEEMQILLASINGYVLNELGIDIPGDQSGSMFEIWSDEITTRMDPLHLRNLAILKRFTSKYKMVTLGTLLAQPPQYGANERAVAGVPGENTRYIRITDIDKYGNLKDGEWKTAERVNNKYALRNGDLLFARSGATAGKSFIYRDEYGKAIFAGYMIRFIVDQKKADPDFVFFFTKTRLYDLWVKTIQRPSGQPNINSGEFKSLEIPLPPIEIQKKIAIEAHKRRKKAKMLEEEIETILRSTQKHVEQMIFT